MRMNEIKEKKIESNISKFFLFLIFFGIIKNAIDYRYYEQWPISDWLISYAGGFVRRGLSGEIIYKLSLISNLSPIFIIHFISIISFFSFLFLLKDCRKYFSTLFLLSPLISLFPLLSSFLMRKDIFGIVIFAISTPLIPSINKLNFFFIINLISSIAILIHESYFFYAIPAFILLYICSKKNKLSLNSFFKVLVLLLPTILTMMLCITFKGDSNTAQLIHYSWQKINNLIPSLSSIGGLNGSEPVAAIEALGWDLKKGLGLSLSTLNSFENKIIWTPLVWLFTIFISAKIFIGDKNNENKKIKILILTFQLISISPLFILGWDFGRWIFIWLASSLFLTKEFTKLDEKNKLSLEIFNRFLPDIENKVRGIQLKGNSKYFYFLIAIPHCCWSISNYIKTTPIFYLLKSPLKILFDI